MDERIKLCPFCGGEAKIMNLNHGTWVECSNYHYERHQVCVHAKTEAEAIAAWNTRAELGSGTCDWLSLCNWLWQCSNCGEKHHRDDARNYKYCPSCGAKCSGKVVSA